MLYDVVITVLAATGIVGAIWASRQLSKAAREGKLYVVGIVKHEPKLNSDVDKQQP